MRVFLWDIDGTLLLTGGAGLAAFNRVFLDLYSEEYIWQGIKPDGRTDDWIIEELYRQRFNRLPTRDEKEKIVELYGLYMEEELPRAAYFRLMPMAREVLEGLSSKSNVSLGLATGNLESTAWAKLRVAGLDHFFHYGGFGSDSPLREELTARALERAIEHLGSKPKETYIVGDTVHDIRCGHLIGAHVIAVCTGSTTREELDREKPFAVLDDLSQFDQLGF